MMVAWTIGYFAMQLWLNNFAYRTHMDGWTFILSGLVTLVIAAATVGYKSFKAGTANPINSLRDE